MRRLIAYASILAALSVPTVSFAQTADGSVAPAPTTTTTAPRPDLTAAQAQPVAQPAAANPNVITLPPVEQTIEIAAAAPVNAPWPAWMTALAGFLAGILATLGVQQARKQRAGSQKCSCCGGSGRESSCDPCGTCNGTGLVDDTQELSGPCLPCGGSGEETCTSCDGEIELEGAASCSACARTGKNLEENGGPAECGFCGGEGELSGNANRQVPCPTCQ